MSEARRIYRVQTNDPAELNRVLAQLAERLDQIEGYRGIPDFLVSPTSREQADQDNELILRSQHNLKSDEGHTHNHSLIVDDEENQHIDWTDTDEDLLTSGDVQGATSSVGDVGGGDYTEIEADGTIVSHGDARVYNDIQFQISSGKVPAANFPTWENLTGTINEYSFDVSDHIDVAANELAHWWDEGTDISVHAHVAPKTANSSGSDQTVRVQLAVAYADVGDVWTSTTLVAEMDVPDGTAALTHMLMSIGTLSLPSNTIGTQVKLHVTRKPIVVGAVEYADNLFITQIGFHAIQDTLGSRELATK